ncbi:DUF1906 domain-containing protein [Spirillospora sp. NPDC048911]|uniref:DUF1906 domain-containing protein n=1 Tax=Spirillospora sp. NPDC048911 TaxID=3364527 RepID=UPI003722522C
MRHAVVLGGLLGVAGLAPLVTGLEPAAARSPAVPAAALTGAHLAQYRGVRVPVPAGWEVHRLDLDPTRCVRHDRPALYLGRQGSQPDCPARLIGGAETLHIEPLDGAPVSAQRRREAVRATKLARFTVPDDADHEVRIVLPEVGAAITGVYGADTSLLQDVIRSIRLTADRALQLPFGIGRDEPARGEPAGTTTKNPPARPARPARSEPARGVRTDPTFTARGRGWVTGKGFDTCTAPSVRTMAAWRRSYGVTNIYIGGASRGCSQPNLTRYWVRTVRRMGYRLIPTYVGLQAPCNEDTFRAHFKAKAAARQGRLAAADAVARARALGIPRRRPIYFDMEAYPSGKTKCRQAVLTFLNSWSHGLAARRYISGVYSSAGSAVRDLGQATGITKPKAIWFAHWDGKPTAYGSPYLLDHWWHPHRRIKQYRGSHKEKHGGVKLNIDSNHVDGRVY